MCWFGGCFVDEYYWCDGIGDLDKCLVKVNIYWGGVEEINVVGIYEIFDFIELLGVDVYINGNLGSGSVCEMVEWVEYMIFDKNFILVNECCKNGCEEFWDIVYFGIGNESWGCGGYMSLEYYVDLYN